MKNSTFSAQVANNLLKVLQGYSKTIRLLLVMFLTLTASTAWGAKITTYSSIVTGKTYYIGATTGGTDYYLSVSGASTSTSIAATAVTTKANATAFVFTGSGTSWTIKFADYANYLGLKSSKDNGKVQVVSAATFIASNQSGKLRLSIGSYSIQKNNSGTQFGSYGNTQTDIWLEEVSGSDEPTTTYTIKWHTAKGVTTDVILNEGAAITKPATDPTMSGYEFMGWTDQCSVAEDGDGFTPISNFGTADSDKEFYAVFAVATTTDGGGGSATETTATVTVQSYASANSWTNGTQYTSFNVDANITASVTGSSNTGKYYTSGHEWRIYQTENPTLTLTAAEGNTIKTAKVTYNINNTGVLKLNGANVASGTASTINASSVTYSVGNTGSATNGQVKVTAIEVIYTSGSGGGSTTTYSDYITTCGGSTPEPDPIPVTGVSLDKTSHTMQEGETVTLTATVTPDNADDKTVTWKSNNDNVAKVSTNGVVTAVSPGNATITVTTTDGELTATCTITVNALPTVEGTWTLVTNAANLKAGDRIVIAAAEYDFALSTTQNSNNRGQASVTKNGNSITFTEATQILTLETGTVDNTLAFNTGAGYLYAASSSNNYLRTQTTNNENGSWSISIDGSTGVATVVAQGENTNNTLFYNQSSKLFSCYANTATQKAIVIYKEGGGATTYTITSTLSHVTADGGNPITITSEAEDLTLSYSAESGWNLPATISVTMGGTPLILDNEYTWNKENGKVWIVPANGFTGNIVVTINGWQQLAAPTGLNVANITSSSATLSWNTVTNASSYTVFITDLDDEEITLTDIEKTSVDVTRLSSETLYLWDVVAIGDGINYTDSEHSSQEDPNAEFTTSAAATPTAGYTIIHHRQALDGNYIADSLVVKTTGTAEVGSTITAEKKTYTGFVCNDAEQTITIQEDAAQNVVTYKYVRQSYTLTWDLDGGNIIAGGTPAGTVKYGAPLTAPTVEKAGYRFDHWNPNVPATMPDGNRTYKAFYTQQHTVKWVSQGDVIRTDIYDTGDPLLAAPTDGIVLCDGKNHVGWTAQGGYAHSTAAPADLFTESSGTVTADATYYAVYAEGSGGGGTGWTAVTSTSDLEAGATYAISNAANGGTYLSTWDGGNNFDGSTTTICPLVLGGETDAWTFQISYAGTYDNYYLTATNTTDKNYLKAVKDADNYSKFTISFNANNAAEITCAGKDTRNILRYNANNGSPIFACYSSGQSDVYLQKQTGGGGYTNYTTSCATITDITIEGYTTEFTQYDEFVFGGTVYAIYDEVNKTDVTELATFTGYDMSQAGTQTVIVSYLDFTATYEITINAVEKWQITWNVSGATSTGLGPKEVAKGTAIGKLPQPKEIPAGCTGKEFRGWTESNTVNSDGSNIEWITEETVPTANTTYYAVFAKNSGKDSGDGNYVKLTDTPADLSGEYLIVYEDAENSYTDAKAFNGGLTTLDAANNTIDVTINGNTIESTDDTDAAEFTIAPYNGGYSIKSASGYFIGQTSYDNDLASHTTTQYINNIAIESSNAIISCSTNGGDVTLKYNKTSGQTRFRYYKTGQQPIALYKKSGSSASYTDYTTGCHDVTITYYGFTGGYTTNCGGSDLNEITQRVNSAHTIPNCTEITDPTTLGRTFLNLWKDQNGKVHQPGETFIVTEDITLYAQWKLETTGDVELSATQEDLATTDIVVTGGHTLTIPDNETITINSLTLKGGLLVEDDSVSGYAMPSVVIPDNATLVRKNTTIYLDLVVNQELVPICSTICS